MYLAIVICLLVAAVTLPIFGANLGRTGSIILAIALIIFTILWLIGGSPIVISAG